METPRIDVLLNSPGPWAEVRVGQPFAALAAAGWDVQVLACPFRMEALRPGSLVIWQRPLPNSWEEQLDFGRWIRRLGCLWLLEWDDHPALFPAAMQAKFAQANHAHLRLPHAIQTSSLALAQVLQRFHPHVLVVENAVTPLPSLDRDRQRVGAGELRLFLANFNREREHRALAAGLAAWLAEPQAPTLVTVGRSGLEGLGLPPQRLELHPPLPYRHYRQLLSSCHIALLPLARGEAQACKTAIKWQECAAESVAVVAGPELYRPWLESDRLGLWAPSLEQVVPLARQLAADPLRRVALVARAHARVQTLRLSVQLEWRMALYRHLWRLRGRLDRNLLLRWPQLQEA